VNTAMNLRVPDDVGESLSIGAAGSILNEVSVP
jgi:hypothetical protein